MADAYLDAIGKLIATNEFITGSRIDALKKAYSGKNQRLDAVKVLSADSSLIASLVTRNLLSDFPRLIAENGPISKSSSLAIVLKEIDCILRFSTYDLLAGDDASSSTKDYVQTSAKRLASIGIPLDIVCYIIDLLQSECVKHLGKSGNINEAIIKEVKLLFESLNRSLIES